MKFLLEDSVFEEFLTLFRLDIKMRWNISLNFNFVDIFKKRK